MFPTDESKSGVWSRVYEASTPYAAAMVAITPTMRHFVEKTNAQLDRSGTSMTRRAALVRGLMASPPLAGTIGTQIMLQPEFERIMMEWAGSDGKPNITSMSLSCAAVGFFSVPFLTMFAAQQANKPMLQALRDLSPKQVAALVGRETSFVAAVQLSGPLGVVIKERFGDNRIVDYSATAATAAISSLAGQMFDTAYVRWNEGLPVESVRQLAAGTLPRMRGVVGFTLIYKGMKELLGQFS